MNLKAKLVAALLLLGGALPHEAGAQNPFVQTCYTSDPAPMVHDGTLYVYTGHDEDKADFFWMQEWRVYSTKDMVNWTDHGSPLAIESFDWADDRAWAAQCVERNGKFYWYVCLHSKLSNTMAIGVAVGDSPVGPFKDAIGKPLHDGSWDYIDPTVFIDDDGRAYLYWGNPNIYCAELNDDMISLKGEVVRYYSNIVGKYGSPVQKALQKLGGLPITTICSTHGPVWTENISRVIGIYDRLSRYDADEGVVIVYGSMYGNTEQMAEAIAAELSAQGIRNIVMHNVTKSHPSYILADIFRYKGLIVGSPTYSNQIFPEVESLLSKILVRELKGRYLGYFGSFTWAGAAVKRMAEFAEKSKFELVGDPVEMKQAMQDITYTQCENLARAMADRLKKDR